MMEKISKEEKEKEEKIMKEAEKILEKDISEKQNKVHHHKVHNKKKKHFEKKEVPVKKVHHQNKQEKLVKEEEKETMKMEEAIDEKISEKQNKVHPHKADHNKKKKHVEKQNKVHHHKVHNKKKKHFEKKEVPVKKVNHNKKERALNDKNIPTLQLKTEDGIAMDFAVKVYKKFDKIVKSIVLFGSATKQTAVPGSDIDVMILIDDSSIKWDQQLIAWYREELERIIQQSPYKKNLHINTVKLSTWWEDLLRGDPVVLNILRYGDALIDSGGFFNPLKKLLIEGKIKSTPESIYACLQRAPMHLARSKSAELGAIEGLYWAMVDSAHAALIATNVFPPSPEHISGELKNNFVNSGKLKMKYVVWFRDMNILHKQISHGEITDLKGVEIDDWQTRTEEFLSTMAQLVNELV